MDIETVKEVFCDDYCKMSERYLAVYKDPDEANAAMMAAYCDNCPLNKLEALYKKSLRNDKEGT